MNYYTKFHTSEKATIVCIKDGVEPILKNAIKTAIIPVALLESTLRNVNSQVKSGYKWEVLA